MKFTSIVATLFLCWCSGTSVAIACESYESYSQEQSKQLRDILLDAEADELDRLYAFDALSCSDSPTLRHYATEKGLENFKKSLLRNRVMLRTVMEMKRVDIELVPNKKLTAADKGFVEKHAGLFSKVVVFKSEEEGCLSFYDEACDIKNGLFVVGNKVEFGSGHVFGKFELSGSGELIGFIRAQDHQNFGRIPAIIKLY